MYIMNEMDVFTLHNIGFNVAALSFKKQRDGISNSILPISKLNLI